MADAELPNFQAFKDYINAQVGAEAHLKTAVLTWAEKLEGWCKDRLEEREALKDNGMEQVQAEIEDQGDTYDDLVRVLHDVERGLAEWDDVKRLLPNPLGERAPGGPI